MHEATIIITAGLSIDRRINLPGAVNLLRPSSHPVPDVSFYRTDIPPGVFGGLIFYTWIISLIHLSQQPCED